MEKELEKFKKLANRFEQKLIKNQFRKVRDKNLGNLWLKINESKSCRNLVFYVELANYLNTNNGIVELTVLNGYDSEIIEQMCFDFSTKGINACLKSLNYWINDRDLKEKKKK